MLLRRNAQARIENPRNYSSPIVAELQNLLKSGGEATSDPKRLNFYEIENEDSIFYVHVSPISGNVVLLAKWSTKSSGECCMAGRDHQAA